MLRPISTNWFEKSSSGLSLIKVLGLVVPVDGERRELFLVCVSVVSAEEQLPAF